MLEESLVLFGFMLGIRHAFDADHIAAVSALVSRNRNLKKSIFLGAFWGLGHTTTLLIVGVLVLGLKITIPEKMALSFEFVVGLVVVLLGVSVLNSLLTNKHTHKHAFPGGSCHHVHHKKKSRTHNNSQSFVVGLLHGLAGSATLLFLVLSTVQSLMTGLLYILVFGVGSIVGMTLASTAISLPFITVKNVWNTRIKFLTGLFSIFFGIVIMIKTIEGLL